MNNILVVDQSNIMRLKVRSIVSSPKINVLEASDVEEVKNDSFASQYSLADIDLLILDIQFGEDNDFSLLGYFQEKRINVPVIILSSNDRRQTILKAYSFGVADYLLKPFDGQVLKSKVNYYLLKDNQQEQLNNFNTENNFIDYFKLDLLEELSRALRGGTKFSILKLLIKENKDIIITKDLLLSLMRGIDKIYRLSETEFILLVPLTNKSGAQILYDRLNNYLIEHLDGNGDLDLDLLISFPQDITEQGEQDKIVEYQNQIINKLFK